MVISSKVFVRKGHCIGRGNIPINGTLIPPPTVFLPFLRRMVKYVGEPFVKRGFCNFATDNPAVRHGNILNDHVLICPFPMPIHL